MNSYFFTFSKHSAYRDQIMKVAASSHKQAIAAMEKRTGNAWDMVYSEDEYVKLTKEGE